MKNTLKDRRFLAFARRLSAILLVAGMGGPFVGAYDAQAIYHRGGAAQSTQPAAVGKVVVVDMNDALRFAPDEIQIKVGDTVEWRNVGAFPHTVTADPQLAINRANVALPKGVKAFNSGRLDRSQTFRYTFAKAGEYKYFCIPHEGAGMLGKIVVK